MKKWIFLFLAIGILEGRIDPAVQQSIMDKHGPNTTSGSARFHHHITMKRLEKLAKETIGHGKERKDLSTEGTKVYEYRFHLPVGIDRNGEKSRTLRVHATPKGEILDAYPN